MDSFHVPGPCIRRMIAQRSEFTIDDEMPCILYDPWPRASLNRICYHLAGQSHFIALVLPMCTRWLEVLVASLIGVSLSWAFTCLDVDIPTLSRE